VTNVTKPPKSYLTVYDLYDHEACDDQVLAFQRVFGDAAEVTASNLRLAQRAGLDVTWCAKLLRAQALAEYERVRAQAWAEYERVRAQAWAEYERVTAPALLADLIESLREPPTHTVRSA